jgi:glycosyltransferase involved in cell wall biosynthesis
VSQKGVLDLVDIMKRINKSHPEFKLTIVGDGPEKQLLMDKMKRENIDSIKLAGFVSVEGKNQVLKRSKFFLFPSKEEGWGISLAEALYSEAICICYGLPHYKGIFADYPIYIENNSKEEFARQVIESYHQEPSEHQKEFVRKYDYVNIVKKLNLTLLRLNSLT